MVFKRIVLNLKITSQLAVIIMALNVKKLSLYVIAGVSVAILVIAAVYSSGIQLPSSQGPGSQNTITLGTLVVYIKDAPVELSELWVTIDSIEVQSNNGWTKLTFKEGEQMVNFELLSLEDISLYISETQLPTGDYSKIRLHVQDATATFENGETVDLKVPSEKIDIIVKFQIEEGATTKVLIDMTADWVSISNSHNLRPVLKATVTDSTTSTAAETPNTTNTTTTPTPTESPTSTPTESSAPTETLPVTITPAV